MRSTVKGYVRKAFALLSDLAEDVDFIISGSTGFNYSTGLPSLVIPVTHTFRAVVLMVALAMIFQVSFLNTFLTVPMYFLWNFQLFYLTITNL